MNQRKPQPCPTFQRLPAMRYDCSCSARRGASPRFLSSASFVFPHSSGSLAVGVVNDALQICTHRCRDLDTTCRHVIMSAMSAIDLHPLPPCLRLSGMLSALPFASFRLTGLDERRSLYSLAAIAGRVANGLRVSPAGSCSPARRLAPSCPPLRALAWGLFAALHSQPFAAQKSTVVSLL